MFLKTESDSDADDDYEDLNEISADTDTCDENSDEDFSANDS